MSTQDKARRWWTMMIEQQRAHRELRGHVAEDVERLEEAVAPLVASDLREVGSASWIWESAKCDPATAALEEAYTHALASAVALKAAIKLGAVTAQAYDGALRQACRVRLALAVREATLGVDRDDHEVHLRSLCLRVADALAQHYADEGSVADIRQAGQEGDRALCQAELVLLGADGLHLLPDALREEVLTELPILRPLYEKWVAEVIDA